MEVPSLVAPIAVIFKSAHWQERRTSILGFVREVATIICSVTHCDQICAGSCGEKVVEFFGPQHNYLDLPLSHVK